MIESVLRGVIQIHPRAEGGRNLVIHTGPDTCTRIPLEAEIAPGIGTVIAMSDEDFAAEMQRREMASRLQVVGDSGTNGNTPH